MSAKPVACEYSGSFWVCVSWLLVPPERIYGHGEDSNRCEDGRFTGEGVGWVLFCAVGRGMIGMGGKVGY